jgi:hypothetical protein
VLVGGYFLNFWQKANYTFQYCTGENDKFFQHGEVLYEMFNIFFVFVFFKQGEMYSVMLPEIKPQCYTVVL